MEYHFFPVGIGYLRCASGVGDVLEWVELEIWTRYSKEMDGSRFMDCEMEKCMHYFMVFLISFEELGKKIYIFY